MIPDRLSDMDSIPETISLSRNQSKEAAICSLSAATEDLATHAMPAFADSIDRLTTSLKEFTTALEVAELNRIYHLHSHS